LIASRLLQGIIWGAIGLVLLVMGIGLVRSFVAQPDTGAAPDFTITTFDGDSITLSAQRGKVVVINFWASWCVPCEQEAPDLEKTWEKYRDQGVLFIGVDYVDSEEKARAFIARYGITYPNGPDLRTEISDLYHIRGVPETFIVDRDGQIVFFAQEPLTYAKLSAGIDQALGK
jgi:cytochrome c biogenesis protein CcmG/thiol:disulfide interchange protein DsbE